MAKRTLRAEPKKECPSCGLGVTSESTVCEFCGWNFEEEDEWILQIEKLERELMLEKQRYEPGTVDHMLESTLRSPLLDKVESSVPQNEDAIDIEEAEPEREEAPAEDIAREEPVEEETPQQERVARVSETTEPEDPKVRRVRSVKAPETVRGPLEEEPVAEEGPVAEEPPERTTPMPIRKVKARPQEGPEGREEEDRPVRKVRTVRRVKR